MSEPQRLGKLLPGLMDEVEQRRRVIQPTTNFLTSRSKQKIQQRQLW